MSEESVTIPQDALRWLATIAAAEILRLSPDTAERIIQRFEQSGDVVEMLVATWCRKFQAADATERPGQRTIGPFLEGNGE